MSENIIGPFGAGVNETTTRPNDPASGSSTDTWFQDCVDGIAGTGTKVPAVFLNKVSALLRRAIRGMGVPDLSTDDDMLLKALLKAQRGVESEGATGDGIVDLQHGINASSNKIKIRKIRGVGITFSIDPTNGEVVATLGGGAVTLAGIAPALIMQEIRAGTAAPATLIGGAWTTRPLNTTVVNQIPGATISGGDITLPAGTYRVDFSSCAHGADAMRARVYDISNSVVLAQGITVDSHGTGAPPDPAQDQTVASTGVGRFTLADTATIRMQIKNALANCLMGDDTNIGSDVHIDSYISLIKEG